jgi:hypothetical protein
MPQSSFETIIDVHRPVCGNLQELALVLRASKDMSIISLYKVLSVKMDRLCSLVVRFLGYRSGGPGSISGTTIKKK